MNGLSNGVKITARIGMVNYINTAPLYEVWRQSVRREDWRITEAPPSVLNRMLHENELDLGFVSSQEYALHPGEYRIMSDLSISSTGPVGSVFLFSELPIAGLDEQLVLLSPQSQTSVSLVKIILEEFHQVHPRYRSGLASELGQDAERPAAVLAIGDEALRLAVEARYPHRLDLGEAWQERTGLPLSLRSGLCGKIFAARNRTPSLPFIRSCTVACVKERSGCLRSAPLWPSGFPWTRRHVTGISKGLSMIWAMKSRRR